MHGLRLLCLTSLLLLFSDAPGLDDDSVAHRLYLQGRYAEAAEIFTDPAWKGVALFKSDQWWRAAEAFVRANDADSLFNLGNCYVKLGYYALALESYQAAIAMKPGFDDAEFNAALMRKLLNNDDEDNGESALDRQAREIEKIDSDNPEKGQSSDATGDDTAEPQSDGNDRDGDTDDKGPMPVDSTEGDSGEAGSQQTAESDGAEEGGTVKGTEADTQPQDNPSGGSEGREQDTDANAGGLRTALHTEQATEQWLNQIENKPYVFLQRKIELSLNRRRASGESAPEGGSQW